MKYDPSPRSFSGCSVIDHQLVELSSPVIDNGSLRKLTEFIIDIIEPGFGLVRNLNSHRS